MTDEINDYAPALLKIKAAIKELEADLPAKDWISADQSVLRAQEGLTELRDITWHKARALIVT